MPIVLVHGVSVRTPAFWPGIDLLLRKHIAPEISDDPKGVPIIRAYWGDLAASFAWDGLSRPRSPLLGQGAAGAPAPAPERAILAADLQDALRDLPRASEPAAAPVGGLTAGRTSGPQAVQARGSRLRDLTPEQLSDLTATAIDLAAASEAERALAALAADTVAHDPATRTALAACATREEELAVLRQRVAEEYSREQQAAGGLVGQGALDWVGGVTERVAEALDRGVDLPGAAATRLLAEVRAPLNDLATEFIGDVLVYLRTRGEAARPGPIPERVLGGLAEARNAQPQRNGEPIVVLSHSMGGQIVYDLVTGFIPNLPAYQDVRVDFWCATASQVGLFEELKLFLASTPTYGKAMANLVPFPAAERLGSWWNVWDHNDFISYRVRDIVDGVDDGAYDSGMWLVSSHGGYLRRPSFFRAFATRLRAAKDANWRRS